LPWLKPVLIKYINNLYRRDAKDAEYFINREVDNGRK